ncbi:DUF308 domain-containing protein [Candidatus Saccharibacteria bacterium]|nr:DUF308 domain-containing protein [Candidatus Saccharibacteria bacterium]
MPKTELIKRPIEKIGLDLKKSAWFAVAESLAIIIFGILMIVWPDITVTVIANILGAIFIVSGIYQIVNYFVVKGQNDFFNNGLLVGVISLLIGIAAIVIGENIANVFRIIIGIWMIYESLVRVNTAIKLHSVGVNVWRYVLAIALVMLALGLFVVFNTDALFQLIGWVMVFAGVVGIVGDVMFIQQINTVVDKLTK